MNTIQTPHLTTSRYAQMCLVLAITFVVVSIPDAVFAQNSIGDTLCKVVNFFTGKIGKAIATLAIIVVGVGALMGKVSWGMAIIVALGVAIVFGAATIVNEISDDGANATSCGRTTIGNPT